MAVQMAARLGKLGRLGRLGRLAVQLAGRLGRQVTGWPTGLEARQAEQAGGQGQKTTVAGAGAHEADGQGAQEAEKATVALGAFLGEHLDPVVGSLVKRNPTSSNAPVAAAELQADEASADDHRGAGRPLVVVAAVGCGAAALIAGVLVVRAWRGLLAPAPPPTTSLLVPSSRSSVL